jgi:hypothetical protein
MEENNTQSPILHDIKETNSMNTLFSKNMLIILVVVGVLGIGTGYLLSSKNAASGVPSVTTNSSGSTATGTVEGSDDLKTFKDIAEGDLKEGGAAGEGQYHLVRPGGESQNVYLTSSQLDLSKYVGKKIKVWGQTQKAQKVGWLMDVGRVEVLK